MKLYRRNKPDREQKEAGCGGLKNVRTPKLAFEGEINEPRRIEE